MEKRNESDAMLCRNLDLCDVDGKVVGLVQVFFWKPVPDEHCDWSCTYRIDGLSYDHTMSIVGVDAIQAYDHALMMAGVRLGMVANGGDHHVRWLGSTDLGFPKLSCGPQSVS